MQGCHTLQELPPSPDLPPHSHHSPHPRPPAPTTPPPPPPAGSAFYQCDFRLRAGRLCRNTTWRLGFTLYLPASK